MKEYSYRDTWGGKNYGCYPINTPGKILKDKIDASNLWILQSKQDYIDQRNDNQVDIDRGSDFSYKHSDGLRKIDVYMSKSRSGKTVDWRFSCNFDESICF